MTKGKYHQMKAWPTRRIHLFFSQGDTSLCGSVTAGQSFPHQRNIDWTDLYGYHLYDNLNFCQSCLRSAMATHSEKYIPLSKVYENLRGVK